MTVVALFAVLPRESVTMTQYDIVDESVPVLYVCDVAPLIAVVHPAFEYHWYRYPPEPPDGLAVSVCACPTSTVGLAGDIETLSAGLTIIRSVAAAVPLIESITTAQYVVDVESAPVLYVVDVPRTVPVHVEPRYHWYVENTPLPSEAVVVRAHEIRSPQSGSAV